MGGNYFGYVPGFCIRKCRDEKDKKKGMDYTLIDHRCEWGEEEEKEFSVL